MVGSGRIQEWLEKEDGRAASTKQGQVRQLDRFLRKTGLTEGELVEAAKNPERIERIADGFVRSEKKAGRRAAYALAVWYAVKSFLKSVRIDIPYNPGVRPEELEPKDFASRRVPSVEELRRLVDSVSLRNRAIVLFLASSGVRVGVLATGVGSDGLRLENLPDLDTNSGTFTAKPPLVSVPARLSKNGKPYMTAISTEAATVLENYLDQRIRSGEKLTPKTPVFIPDPRGVDREARTAEGFRTLNRNGLSTSISEWFRGVAPPGIRWTAHTLRAWCSSRLEKAEGQGLISRTRREFFLGHSLGVDGKYNLSRPLSTEAREELRASYRRAEPLLLTVPTSDEEERKYLVRTELLKTVGYSAEEAEKYAREDKADIPKLIRDKLGTAATAQVQRIVSVDDARPLLTEGWKVVTLAGPGVLVLNPPV